MRFAAAVQFGFSILCAPAAMAQPVGDSACTSILQTGRTLALGQIDLALKPAGERGPMLVCARLAACEWGPITASQEELAGLGPFGQYSGGRICHEDVVDGSKIEICDKNFTSMDLAKEFSSAANDLASRNACSMPADLKLSAEVLRPAAGSVLLFRIAMKNSDLCVSFAARSSDFLPIFIVGDCNPPADAPAEFDAILAEAPSPKAGGLLVATVSRNRGFRLEFTVGANGEISIGQKPAVWGISDQNGTLTAWLSAVAVAASSVETELDFQDLPLDGLVSAKEPVPKVLQWFAAAVVRARYFDGTANASQPSLAKHARNWMVRTSFSAGSATVLRAENVTWGAP